MTLHQYVKQNDISIVGSKEDGIKAFDTSSKIHRLSDWVVVTISGSYVKLKPRPGREQEYCGSCGWLGCTSSCDQFTV